MNDRAFDALSRRASLAALSGAGLLISTPPVAEAKRKNKNKKGKNKTDKKARRKCAQQGDECTFLVGELCGGDAPCLERLLPCCEFAERCDFSETLRCLFLIEA